MSRDDLLLRKMKSGSQERNISLDVLRALVMLMIVLGHVMLHGQVVENIKPFTVNYFVSYTVFAFIYVHVNCFVLISGYFLSVKEFKYKKIFSLWGKMFFWSIMLFIFLVVIGATPFSMKIAIKAMLPFTQQRYWFMTTYLLMYCLMPFLNAAIRFLSKKQYQIALFIFFIIYIVLQNIFFWEGFTTVNAHSPLFFAFLYLGGGYIRKYPIEKKIPWFCLYILCAAITAISRFVLSYVTIKIFGEMYGESMLYTYNSITMVIGSFCLFMTFQTLKINKESVLGKLAVWISPLTLGVYLIHDHPEIRPWLWSVLKPYQFAESPFLVFWMLGLAILVFLSCCILEKCRMIIVEKLMTYIRKR